MHLDGISDGQMPELHIPTGIPLACVLSPDMRPVTSAADISARSWPAARPKPGTSQVC